MTFSNAVKKLREELNITQELLECELNVSFDTVNKWKRNRTKPLCSIRDRLVGLSKNKNMSKEVVNALT